MCILVNIEKAFLCHVGVDLRGGETSMAEEFLNAPEIRAPIEEMGGETMAEGVRTGTQRCQTVPCQVLLEQPADAPRGEPFSESVEKERRFAG